jgi:hypothetical protein
MDKKEFQRILDAVEKPTGKPVDFIGNFEKAKKE